MWPPVVGPLDPVANNPVRFVKRLDRVLPDTLFFETAKKPFNDPSPIRRSKSDELLLKAIVPTGLPKSTALEDQAVVAAEDRGFEGPQRAKPCETGGFHRPLRLLRPTAQCELVANELPIMAINLWPGRLGPSGGAGDMRDVHRPAFVAPTGATDTALYAGPRGRGPLMHKPPFDTPRCDSRRALLGNAAAPRAADSQTWDAAESTGAGDPPRRVRAAASLPGHSRPMQAGAADLEYPTTASFRDTRLEEVVKISVEIF